MAPDIYVLEGESNADVPPLASPRTSDRIPPSRPSTPVPPLRDNSVPPRRKTRTVATSTGAPPRPFPLFNRTFAILGDRTYWLRLAALEGMLCPFATTLCAVFFLLLIRGDFYLLILFQLFSVFVVAPCYFLTASGRWALFFLTLWEAGAEGRRRVGAWTKGDDDFDGVKLGLAYFTYMVVSLLPTALALRFYVAYDFPYYVDWLISGSIGSVLFPIIALSTRLANEPRQILHKDVLITLVTKFPTWIQLFVATAVVFNSSCLFFGLLTYWLDAPWSVFCFPMVLLFLSGPYALVLGRMEWIIKVARRRIEDEV